MRGVPNEKHHFARSYWFHRSQKGVRNVCLPLFFFLMKVNAIPPSELPSHFIVRCYRMVNDSRCSTIQWNARGDSFLILNEERFCTMDLMIHFPRFPSHAFFDLLRTCEFQRINSDPIEYFHPYFRQDRQDLLPMLVERIPRTPSGLSRSSPYEILNLLCRQLVQTEKRMEGLQAELHATRHSLDELRRAGAE